MSVATILKESLDLLSGFKNTPQYKEFESNLELLLVNKDYSRAFRYIDRLPVIFSQQVLTTAGSTLVDTEFNRLSDKLKAEIIRYELSGFPVAGYGINAELTARIVNERNKSDGLLAAALLIPLISRDRVKGFTAKTIKEVLDGNSDQAVEFYNAAGESIVKTASVDAQLQLPSVGSTEDEEDDLVEVYIVEGRRVPNANACDYCKSKSNYWTSRVDSIAKFHDYCRCIVETRNRLIDFEN